ncbi:hypothetical protein OOK60_00210 [Trichothermofontia sichuanensis B231]|uniref:hypothetical protein n=1 Tax=Trichothermofontia sichuanensis TaxID=3045816 RepID=UPI0022483CF6|nr:hypothetical protein [Trichothermofontia sichuanensis]UZQ54540.1 hypothetical protein OOK60_00210 [Trichothermofontia sichuanensis B231]
MWGKLILAAIATGALQLYVKTVLPPTYSVQTASSRPTPTHLALALRTQLWNLDEKISSKRRECSQVHSAHELFSTCILVSD